MHSMIKSIAFAGLLACVAFPALATDKPAATDAAKPAAAAPAAGTSAYKNLSLAVVDIQALLKDSSAAKSIETQIAAIRKSFQEEISKEESALREAEKKIIAEQKTLKEDELKKKAEDFQKKVVASQKKVQDKKAKLDKALADALNTLRTSIVKIVAEIGDKNNLDLVLARTDVVIVSKELDITSQVLARINKDLPDVKVKAE